jgi:hypothetical protein
MERMGLQQELHGSCFTASPVWGRLERSISPQSSQPFSSSLSSQLSQFHSCKKTVINNDLSSYHKSDDQLASLSLYPLPLLGTIGNPIVISDDKDDIESSLSRPSYHEVWLMFTTPSQYLCYDFEQRIWTKPVLTFGTEQSSIVNSRGLSSRSFPKIEFKSEFGECLKECHCEVVLS